jgi:hypothetical protein
MINFVSLEEHFLVVLLEHDGFFHTAADGGFELFVVETVGHLGRCSAYIDSVCQFQTYMVDSSRMTYISERVSEDTR